MGPGAIIIVDAPVQRRSIGDGLSLGFIDCVEVAGRSPLERLLERLIAIDVASIFVLVPAASALPLPSFRIPRRSVQLKMVGDMDQGIQSALDSCAQEEIPHAFVCRAGAYTETDLLDLFCFHRESRQAVTPTFHSQGSLPLWVADCNKVRQSQRNDFLDYARQSAASKYFVREYVNWIKTPRDLRNFSADILSRRCETDPSGRQMRPGVWLDEGAKIHRRARLVSPAYVGCNSEVQADVLITRLSCIERDCCIESGTVIEDSSILAGTNVGICLDVCHAVVHGSKLFNLERDVVVEISDERVMRSAPRSPFATASLDPHFVATPEPRTLPQLWQTENT